MAVNELVKESESACVLLERVLSTSSLVVKGQLVNQVEPAKRVLLSGGRVARMLDGAAASDWQMTPQLNGGKKQLVRLNWW